MIRERMRFKVCSPSNSHHQPARENKARDAIIGPQIGDQHLATVQPTSLFPNLNAPRSIMPRETMLTVICF